MSIFDITRAGAYVNAIQVANGKVSFKAGGLEEIPRGAVATIPPEKNPLRTLFHCYQRAVSRLHSFGRITAEFATSRATLISGLIVVVLPIFFWWLF